MYHLNVIASYANVLMAHHGGAKERLHDQRKGCLHLEPTSVQSKKILSY